MTSNQVPLTQWQTLRDYIASMHTTVDTWAAFFNGFQPQWFPQEELVAWLTRVRHSLEVLENRYVYDTLEVLSIDPQASGFPQRYDVRILEQEYERVNNNAAPHQASSQSLRLALLDHIFAHKVANVPLLEQIGKAAARELLHSAEPLRLFSIRSLTEVEAKNGHRAFVCCWERYGYRNVPTLYTMLFEYSGKGDLSKKDISELALILREETSQMPFLERLGRSIDYGMAHVHPKWIGRLVLGPVFISHITQDNNPLQKALNKVFENGKELGAASRIIYEYVIAEKSVPTDLCDPLGRPHGVIQEFGVRESDDECHLRRVTQVEKTLFAPHSVIRMLDDEYRREIGHQLIGD